MNSSLIIDLVEEVLPLVSWSLFVLSVGLSHVIDTILWLCKEWAHVVRHRFLVGLGEHLWEGREERERLLFVFVNLVLKLLLCLEFLLDL